jgi:protein-S-isoprenylcysteine O-methyltransferase Ste14
MNLALRIYLLVGLVAHKVVWEMMKRADGAVASASVPRPSPGSRFVRLVKIAILGGIILQTLMPEGWLAPVLSETPLRLKIVGTAIFTIGDLLAIAARIQLGANWLDIEVARVLNHQVVVSSGVYSRIRHPIYVGDLLLLIGLELALNSSAVFAVLLLVPVVLHRAIREEQQLRSSLAGYDEYCRTTSRFIPYIV